MHKTDREIIIIIITCFSSFVHDFLERFFYTLSLSLIERISTTTTQDQDHDEPATSIECHEHPVGGT
jgi:hypothetical protein